MKLFPALMKAEMALNAYKYVMSLATLLGGVSKSMLKQSRLNFDKIEKCE